MQMAMIPHSSAYTSRAPSVCADHQPANNLDRVPVRLLELPMSHPNRQVARAMLRRLMQTQPTWMQRDYAQAIGHSVA
jgi:hypothetical protein